VTSTRPFLAQTRAEILMTLRRGESVLLTIAIPVMLLGFFSLVDVLPIDAARSADFLTPGVLALAVMSTAMVSLAIATGFERQYGVLKRLACTPLGRPALLGAKTAAILAVEVVQTGVLVFVGLLLGWRPGGSVLAALVAVLIATVGFAGIGLLMAGTLRAEVTLAAANGLYLVLLLLGGMIIPLDRLPGVLQGLSRLLPAAALSDALHGALGVGGGIPARAWLVLVAWALIAPAAAATTFKWE
jgi:ABC-2 type transport system permease protein